MKRQLLDVLGTIIFVIVAFALSTAHAQTTSNGPYYANPSWDQTLTCTNSGPPLFLVNCPRFVVLSNFNNEAVLDRETGLVWERSPLAPCTNPLFCIKIDQGFRTWRDARLECTDRTTGGRKGWRLPSVHELASLVDPTQSNPALPAGHPFQDVQSPGGGFGYWSATADPDPATGSAWAVTFGPLLISPLHKTDEVNQLAGHFVWCVRGGMNADAY